MKKIVIVDDEQAIRWSLGEALKNEGYETEEIENGKKALKALEMTRGILLFSISSCPI